MENKKEIMHTLTVIILCHEDTPLFRKVVDSVVNQSWVTEVHLIDTHDDTNNDLETRFVKPKHAKIKSFEVPTKWENFDFAQVRNQAIAQIETTWFLFLDSDELLDEVAQESIGQFLSEDGDGSKNDHVGGAAVAAQLQRTDYFHNKPLRYGETGNCFKIRLSKKHHLQFVRPIHETAVVSGGNTITLAGTIKHYSHPSTKAFIDSVTRYAYLEAKLRTWNWVTCLNLIFLPPLKVLYIFFVQFGFLDGYRGLIYAYVMGLHSLFVRVFTYEIHTHHNHS